MILVLDTETTGLPKNYKAPISDLENWPRAVQIAWILYEDNGAEIERRNSIIKPDGFEIPAEATAKHGFTTAYALEHGEPIEVVLVRLSGYIQVSNWVVAHSMDYDENVLGAEFLRAGFENYLTTADTICTMKASTELCAISGSHGYKWPKLSELNQILFGDDSIAGEHDAEVDAAVCGKCLFELVKRGVISLDKDTESPRPSLMAGYTADEKLAMLARERKERDEAKSTLANLLEGLKKSDVWAYHENATRMHADNVERLEVEIKADFVATYDGKNKKPHQFVALKEFDATKVEYDQEKAFRREKPV